MAKNDFSSVFGSVRFKLNCGFQFSFTKLTDVSVFFSSVFTLVLFNIYALYCQSTPSFIYISARNDVLLCWIGPTNCQPKWLRSSSGDWRDMAWSCHVWKLNCEWDNVKNHPQTPEVGFLIPNCGNWVFGFLNFEISSVRFSLFQFKKKWMSSAFFGFRTPLIKTCKVFVQLSRTLLIVRFLSDVISNIFLGL